MEHAPGPRGSPQEPQAPEVAADSPEEPRADTAKTESCGAKCLLWHFGQAAFWLPKIRASNRCSHLVQTYSNIGMFTPPRYQNEYTRSGRFSQMASLRPDVGVPDAPRMRSARSRKKEARKEFPFRPIASNKPHVRQAAAPAPRGGTTSPARSRLAGNARDGDRGRVESC